MVFSVSPETRLVDWVKLCWAAKSLSKYAIVFALGGWMVSIRAQESQLPYMQRATHQAEKIQQAAGPDPLKTIECERRRGAKAEVVAEQAVKISENRIVPRKLLDQIPDCPPPKK